MYNSLQNKEKRNKPLALDFLCLGFACLVSGVEQLCQSGWEPVSEGMQQADNSSLSMRTGEGFH